MNFKKPMDAALSGGCVARSTGTAPIARPPALGQSWRYAQHDVFTGARVDTQTDRVGAVSDSIAVESHFELASDSSKPYPSWGEGWWRAYMGTAARTGGRVGIHRPWGMVVVGPHWSELQSFERAIPLWPLQLRPGWRTTVGTDYVIPSSHETMPWQLTMHADR